MNYSSRYVKKWEDFYGDGDAIPVNICDSIFKIEVCKNPTEGLIGRSIKYDGMIFQFENARPLSFHTRGCIEAIDIVFILRDQIVKIEKNCQPDSPNNFDCPEADTVLEFPSGTCENLGIEVGIFCNI